MLLAVGERGYADASVEDALARCGLRRECFEEHFSDRHSCLIAAHEAALEALSAEVLAPCGGDTGWRAGLDAALRGLLGFVAAEPLLARALFIECAAAPPLEARREACRERFAVSLERARLEPGARTPPPLTERFLVASIEAAVGRAIVAGAAGEAELLLPDLERLVLIYYFGEDVVGGSGVA